MSSAKRRMRDRSSSLDAGMSAAGGAAGGAAAGTAAGGVATSAAGVAIGTADIRALLQRAQDRVCYTISGDMCASSAACATRESADVFALACAPASDQASADMTPLSQIEIKKSRFICFASYSSNKSQAQAFISRVSQAHPSARHIAYAYAFLDGSFIASDNGEPAQTAGLPIYSTITAHKLVDVVVCVVRYFGGTLLGAGGLVRAYTEAAQQGLDVLADRGCIAAYAPCVEFRLSLNYALFDEVKRHILRVKGVLTKQSYQECVECTALIPLSDGNALAFYDYMEERVRLSARAMEQGRACSFVCSEPFYAILTQARTSK